MKPIYVDFDDVLCETARAILSIARTEFNKVLSYEEIHQFDLQITFGLDDDEYMRLVGLTHSPDFLENLLPVPNALNVISSWIKQGQDVKIITGRPVSTAISSRNWLEKNGFGEIQIQHVDKYNRFWCRETPDGFLPALSLEEFKRTDFLFAVEDAPPALTLLQNTHPDLPVAILDRPWNASYIATQTQKHCNSWLEIAKEFEVKSC